MGKIYTKKGDKGNTKTFRGEMSKSDGLAEALGSIDELNSWVGLIRKFFCTSPSDPPPNLGGGRYGGGINKSLKIIQTNLMKINAILAGADKPKLKFNNNEIKKLEMEIDWMTKELPPLMNFIYPVGEIQIVRAVCRRAERAVVRCLNSEQPQIIAYLNRLSDYLFVLARWANKMNQVDEEVWKLVQ